MSEIIASPKKRNNKPLYIALGSTLIVAVIAGFLFFTPLGKGLLDKVGVPAPGGRSSWQEVVGNEAGESGATDTPSDDPNKSNSDGIPLSETSVDKPYSTAIEQIEAGNTNQAVAAYEDRAKKAPNDEERAKEYTSLSFMLWNYGDDAAKQRALAYALQAEDLDPTSASASQVASIYRDMGNIVEAEKYEKLTFERGGEVGN